LNEDVPFGTGFRELRQQKQLSHPFGLQSLTQDQNISFKTLGKDVRTIKLTLFLPSGRFLTAAGINQTISPSQQGRFLFKKPLNISFFCGSIVLPPSEFARIKPTAAVRPCKSSLRQCRLAIKKKKSLEGQDTNDKGSVYDE
jgi:hypothetical protein